MENNNKEFFYGKEIERDEDGVYRTTLADMVDNFIDSMVDNTTLFGLGEEFGLWECENENEMYREFDVDTGEFSDEYKDFYCFFIVDEQSANFLSEHTDEAVFFNDKLDMYMWATDYVGTPWDIVNVNIYPDGAEQREALREQWEQETIEEWEKKQEEELER